MGYTRSTFLGASVRSFNSTMSWNGGGPSSLSVQLVVDPANGDAFAPPGMGTPVYFEFYGFKFYGLFQKYEERKGADGNPVFDVTVHDPRQVLEGAVVILSSYNGAVGNVLNLLNVYGYWESFGYGQSLSDDAGMPWSQVLSALTSLCNQPAQTPYGGPLTFAGHRYALDLSQLPVPPGYYRVGPAVNIGLLDLISQICEDGGYDYFVDLVGSTIRVRTVSRRTQPPLGTISALVNSAGYSGAVIRSSNGLEVRNEVTSAFVVGGEVTTLFQNDSMASYWGDDILGNPILGVNQRLDLADDRFTAALYNPLDSRRTFGAFYKFQSPPGQAWPSLPVYLRIGSEIIQLTSVLRQDPDANAVSYNIQRGMFGTTPAAHKLGSSCVLVFYSTYCDQMNLNASPVADVIGNVSYPCSVLEMRLAKVNYESWAAYMVHYKRYWADRIGMTSPVRNLGGPGAVLHQNLVNDARLNAFLMNQAAVLGDLHTREMRMYELVRGYADEYMGKKFAVGLPFVLAKQDPETLKIAFSYEITDGGYLPYGSAPLGISDLNQDAFQNQDGRFRCFGVFTGILDADLSQVSPQGTVSENGQLYMEARADPTIIFTPTPAAVVTVQGVFQESPDAVGDINVVSAVLQMSPEQGQQVLKKAQFGNVGVKLFPNYIAPLAVAIPLKSNTDLYGPWYAAGSPGKVRFDFDQSLTPWNYGGFTTLNLAANARVVEAITNMQVSEAGSLEVAGPPAASLGDTLQAGGPNVTNIQVSFGSNGVTTTYQFQTFTPKFGVFSKGSVERLRRLAQTDQELRRALRATVREQATIDTAVGNAARAARVFLQNAPKAVRRESPHDILVGYSFADNDPWYSPAPGVTVPGSGFVRVGVSSATFEEAVAFCNADDDTEYQRTAAMSWSGLLRPFCTSPGGGVEMATYATPASGFASLALSGPNLDPWKGPNDIEIWAYGDDYEALNAYREGGDNTNARPLALRAPLVLSGWGYAWDGTPVPGSDGDWVADVLFSSDQWKAGPVDLLWDENRGVWTCHDVVRGVLEADLPTGASALLSVAATSGATGWKLTVFNQGSDLPSGTPVHALYHALDNAWYALPAQGGAAPSGISYFLVTSEFSVASGNIISAVWGTDVQPVGYVDAPGSVNAFARVDHVHEHPVLATGDLHPEYDVVVQLSDGSVSGAAIKVLEFDPAYAAAMSLAGSTAKVWVEEMVGCGPNAARGLVPTPPSTSGSTLFLCENGQWLAPAASAWYFQTPSFLTAASGANGTLVSPEWGASVNSIGWSNSPGTGLLFAMSDHVHAHPVFASGNLHPEYDIVVQLSDDSVSGEAVKVLQFDPDYAAAASVVGNTVTVWFKEMVASGPSGARGLVPQPPSTTGNVKFLREDGTWSLPAYSSWYFAAGFDTASSGAYGTLVSPAWGATASALGVASSAGVATSFSRSDHTHAHGVFASGDLHPEYDLAFTAGFTVAASGYGKQATPSWGTSTQAVAIAGSAGTATSFARSDHSHAHGVFSSGNLHTEYLLANQAPVGYSTPYSLLWTNAVGTPVWTATPSATSFQMGTLWLGSPTATTNRTGFQSGSPSAGDVLFQFPSTDPSGGAFLGVSAWNSTTRVATLGYLAQPSGYTGAVTRVTNVSGSYVTYQTDTFVNGLLVDVSAESSGGGISPV